MLTDVRRSARRWRCATSLALIVALSQLGAQDVVESPAQGEDDIISPVRRADEWFEVVSHRPGPEVTDPVMRRKIVRSGHPWKVRDRATGMEMVLVMPGEFMMGSPESEPGRSEDEGPQHRVRLTRAFYLGATEVSQAQWRALVGPLRNFFEGDDRPAEVSWAGAQAFVAAANAASPSGTNPMRLPTEAEWEYACRAGTTGPFSFEGPPRHAVLNFNDGVVKRAVVGNGKVEFEWETPASPGFRSATAPVGSLPPNAWGLHEMHGNVLEWTADRYDAAAYAKRGPLTIDPIVPGAAKDERTLRGGDWAKRADMSRAAARSGAGTDNPSYTVSNRIGFRVARKLDVQSPPYLRYVTAVRSILHDSRGHYWFGTRNEGVCRFDGERLTYFTEVDGLANAQVRRILEDRNGNVWFECGYGLSRFDGERMETVEPRDYSQLKAWTIEADDLWFKGDEGHGFNEREVSSGVYRYDGQTISYRVFPLTPDRAGQPYHSVTGMARGKGGRLWVATYGAVIGYDGRSFTIIDNESLGLSDETGWLHARCVFEDSQGRVWIGNNGIGVLLVDGDTTTSFTQAHGVGRRDQRSGGQTTTPLAGDAPVGAPSMHRVFEIGEDRDGNIWFGTIEQGAWRYDGESLRQFTEADGLTASMITAIYTDRRGDLWIGGRGGVFMFNGTSFDRIH